jgi:hypothetical protein
VALYKRTIASQSHFMLLITSLQKIPFEKLIVAQLFRILPAIYVKRSQNLSQVPVSSRKDLFLVRFLLILSFHLRMVLPRGLCPSDIRVYIKYNVYMDTNYVLKNVCLCLT